MFSNPAPSIEEARRENRKQKARKQKQEAAEREKKQQFGRFFQYTVPPPPNKRFSPALLLQVRGNIEKTPWSQRTQKDAISYPPLCSRIGPQIALQFNAQWGELVKGFSWDYKKAQNFPDLSVCVSKVSCSFSGWKPAVLRSFEAARVLNSSPAEKMSWVCKPVEEPVTYELVAMDAQIPGPVGYALLRRALPKAISSSGGHHLRSAMEMLERYRCQAQHVPLSCVVNVHGCSPYFFMRWPPRGSRANPEGLEPSAQHVFKVQKHLESLLEKHQGQLPYKTYFKGPYVVGCKVVQRSPLKGLRLDKPWECVELHFCHKQVVSWALSIFETKIGEKPIWNWDQVWGYDDTKSSELDGQDPKPEFGKYRVELLNAKVDPEIQFVTDHQTSGRRWSRLPEGKYLLTPCFPESRWDRQLRAEVSERRFLPAFRLDVHTSYLEAETEEKPPLPLKVCVFDIEVASRTGRFPSTLRGDHIVQIAVETYYDLTEDPILKAYQDRTVFCLGETPSFRTSDGYPVRVVDYSIEHVFIFLTSQALAILDKLFQPTDKPLFCQLLESFLNARKNREATKSSIQDPSALFTLAAKLSKVLKTACAASELQKLAPEITEAVKSKKRNSGRASCLRTPTGQWGSWEWGSTNSQASPSCSSSFWAINYADFIALEHKKPGRSQPDVPTELSSVQHEAARFLFTVMEELEACGGSPSQFRHHSEAYRRAIDLAEAEMLQDCVDWFRRADTSIICGHNTDGYDIPEMLRRAFVLDTPSAWVWSNRARPVSVEDTMFQSAASGTLKITKVEFPGLAVSFDTLKYFKKIDYNTKLPRYNLNTVAAHFLQNQKKANMNYQDILLYFVQGPQTRLLEAMYCMQDVDLLWMILRKRKPFHELLALMERSGISLNHMINKGQMYQSNLQLLPICNQAKVATLWRKKKKEATFQGATVVEPNRGYYSDPVATLDFASLYPSIMSAFNICFTTVVFEPKKNLSAQTLLLAAEVPRVEGETPREWFLRVFRVACAGKTAEACLEHTLASLDEKGVPQSVRLPPVASADVLQFIIRKEYKKGLLPGIVENLMRLRKITKKEMHKSEGIQKTLLNAKQLAQKLMQNSMYGSASLIWRVVGLLITFFGRQLIEFTTKKAQELGAKWGAQVVYGDTDSVFVKLHAKSLFSSDAKPTKAEVIAAAREAGMWLEDELNKLYKTEVGVEGITLECEAVLMNLLLTNKKRYTALMNEVTGSGTRSKGVYTRGMANVRGDQPKFIKENFELIVKTLVHCGLDQAVVAVQCLAALLLHGLIQLEKLILHKGVKKEFYADPVPGHIQLARRLGLQPGDQVPFVLVQANSKALQAEKMESPRSLGEDCRISHREYLERFLVPTFSGLLAIPFTQQLNEIGTRFGDPKESKKDIERRKKLTRKAIFERSTCCVCRVPLSLEQGFPLHLTDQAEIASLNRFFASSGAKKKEKKQTTLSSLWFSSKGPQSGKTKASPMVSRAKQHERISASKESLELGTKWFLCKQCVQLIIDEKEAKLPGAQKILSKTLLRRKLLPQLSLFRSENAESNPITARAGESSLSQKHSSRQNTLKRSLSSSTQGETAKNKRRRRVEIQYSEKEKETLGDLVTEQREKVRLFQKTCKDCRKGTGLDPKDCDADSCEQWFSRVISRRRLRDQEQAHEALCKGHSKAHSNNN